MKYGKYIKKTRRTFRKTSRFARKARKIRYRKRFERRLNSVAEKKVTWENVFDEPLIAATSSALLADGLIKAVFPTQGTETYGKIGSKIFIRYVVVDMWIYNVNDTNFTTGRIGVLIVKERRPASARGLEVQEFFAGGRPIINSNLYKNRQVKKIILKMRYMNVSSNEIPQSFHFKFRFKIFKNCARDSINELPDIADINIVPIYFAAPFSANGTQGPARFSHKVTMSYTDV